ncbi:MAG: Crp/Fnr family transcriptional regulator [Rhizobiaceae bacterium]
MKNGSQPDTSCREKLTLDGWLADQPADFQTDFLSIGTVKNYGQGCHLFRAGDVISHVFGLVDGQIDLHWAGPNYEELVSPSAGRRTWYGFSDAITGEEVASTAIARRSSIVYCIPRWKFIAFLQEDPERYSNIISHENRVRKDQQNVLGQVLTLSGNSLVANLLASMHADEHFDHDASLQITQKDFAASAGVSLPTLQRAFRYLKAEGALDVTYRGIRILNRDNLDRLTKLDSSGDMEGLP